MPVEFFINTLRHRPERSSSVLGVMDYLNYPMEHVHVVYGKYWEDFESKAALLEAILEDGFPELEGLIDKHENPIVNMGWMAGAWSFFRTFRAIQEKNISYAVVMEDDYVFSKDYAYFLRVFRAMPPDLKIGILGYNPLYPLPGFLKGVENGDIRELSPIYINDDKKNEYWGAGIVHKYHSNNNIALYTPEGIEMIRDVAPKSHWLATIERLIGEYLHEADGSYSLITPIAKELVLQGVSDGMPGEASAENPVSIAHVERWQQGYDVEV